MDMQPNNIIGQHKFIKVNTQICDDKRLQKGTAHSTEILSITQNGHVDVNAKIKV